MSDAADRLLKVIGGVSQSTNTVSELSYGTVKSAAPLVITRDGGADLTSEFLVLSKTCKPLSISTATHTHTIPEGEASTGLQSLLIWGGLSVGEKVMLLSFNNSQKFFVERI